MDGFRLLAVAVVDGELHRARNRLPTIAHLAGGQPRVWALLASGLTMERLDDLVSALIEPLRRPHAVLAAGRAPLAQ
jgi:hypothetical protein